jgi:hypothetical protein
MFLSEIPIRALLPLIFSILFTVVYSQTESGPCINEDDCYPVYNASNVLGTSLFGWDKCTKAGVGSLNQKAWINGGWDDKRTIIEADSKNDAYRPINFANAAAIDFWGPLNSVTDTAKTQIKSTLT